MDRPFTKFEAEAFLRALTGGRFPEPGATIIFDRQAGWIFGIIEGGSGGEVPAGLEEQLTAMQEAIDALETAVAALEAGGDIGDLEDRVDAAEAAITALETAVDDLEDDLAALIASLGDLAFLDDVDLSTAEVTGILPISKGGTGHNDNDSGDLLVGDGTAWDRLAIGSDGKILMVVGGLPVWSPPRRKRVVNAADAVAITPNSDNAEVITQTNTQAAGTLTINADTGTAVEMQELLFKIKCTNVQTLAWDAQYIGGAIALPTATTGLGLVDLYSFMWDDVNNKWYFTGQARGFA